MSQPPDLTFHKAEPPRQDKGQTLSPGRGSRGDSRSPGAIQSARLGSSDRGEGQGLSPGREARGALGGGQESAPGTSAGRPVGRDAQRRPPAPWGAGLHITEELGPRERLQSARSVSRSRKGTPPSAPPVTQSRITRDTRVSFGLDFPFRHNAGQRPGEAPLRAPAVLAPLACPVPLRKRLAEPGPATFPFQAQ